MKSASTSIVTLTSAIFTDSAGLWLIPAFHAAIDEGLPDAHDDPQNFDLPAFDAAVTRHLTAIKVK